MNGRPLFIALIREVVRGLELEELKRYADSLPAQVKEGAEEFCEDSNLGTWIESQLILHEISVAYELYGFIQESTSSVVQSKEARASGGKTT